MDYNISDDVEVNAYRDGKIKLYWNWKDRRWKKRKGSERERKKLIYWVLGKRHNVYA